MFNAALDAVAAIVIVLLLAFAIIAAAYLAPRGAPLIDLPGLFADLRGDRRGQYWWLGFMLFSTLLPTVIHLGIGAFAFFTLFSGWLGRPIAAGLMKGDSPEGRLAALALSLAAALEVSVPCLMLWLVAKYCGGWLLDGLLTACAWFHGLLEAWFSAQPAA